MVSWPASARMFTGWRRCRRARLTIADGMVAENSIVWRSSGVWRQDALDVGQEAQIEHLVGLVEHEHLDVTQVEDATIGQVQQAARGADHDLDAGAELVELVLVADSAVDGDHSGLPAA